MASIVTSRLSRSSFFRLPPHLRVSVFQHARQFSASAPRSISLAEIAVAGPTAVLNGVHEFGIPWYAALPLTALLVRTTFVYYFSALPGRRNAIKLRQLQPLIDAQNRADWDSDAKRAERRQLYKKQAPRIDVVINAMTHSIVGRFMRTWKTGAMFGVPPAVRGLINFGVLIAFTEAIRLKCGRREGLLSFLLTPLEWLAKLASPIHFPGKPVVPPVTADELLAQKLAAAILHREAAAQGELTWSAEEWQKAVSEVQPAGKSAITPDTTSPLFDPSMQTEGLNWCTDLTMVDPTQVLPVALFFTMAATVLLRPRTKAVPKPPDVSEELAEKDPLLRLPVPKPRPIDRLSIGQRLGLAVATVMALVAFKMPAAILLYFIPSIAAGWLQNRYLDLKYPLQPVIQPCKRPIQNKVRKEWSDI